MDPNWLSVYDNTRPEGPLGGARGFQKIECVTRYPKPYAFGGTKNAIGWPQFHVHCLYDFLHAVVNGETTGPDFEDGLATQRLIAACQRSAQTGTSVSV